MSNYVIETNDLTKQYEDQISVNHLNIHVPQGKIYALLGRNGAGKTTTMKMILNLVKPTSGTITLFGDDYKTNQLKTYRRIGAIIETPSFYENLTGSENLEILARLRGRHREDSVTHALEIVGLDKETKKTFGKYSMGMKQRLGIAAAIMHEPEVLILDEPINGLDPIGIHEIRNYLLKLCKEKGTTVLISSHVLSEIEQIADIIGVMHQGYLLEETDIGELHKRNRRYAEYEVSDVNKATLVLERQFQITDYTIVDNRFIRLFSEIDKCAEINSSFTQNDISVTRLNIKEEKLEDYFSNLIGGGKIG
ncbi:ABC transporter ATP-binding protein [Proteiniborus sp. MB09-C3]|uniref:ABC transporter ATP-binding protein n=1 Tax=Proteiniborus sp. MB09-C3 TaxID=3050072 RepID=UPI002556F344|nr:ABC transporter ATP-binding protein [Proteiniborus sp. MB09-C3]WIV13402.1 ABC transporter ATP-binding protein [Proteiniborus sp. MB09-C3]